MSKNSLKETKMHFQKYLVDNRKNIKEIFIPMLKVAFGSQMYSVRIWKKKIEKELHREIK